MLIDQPETIIFSQFQIQLQIHFKTNILVLHSPYNSNTKIENLPNETLILMKGEIVLNKLSESDSHTG